MTAPLRGLAFLLPVLLLGCAKEATSTKDSSARATALVQVLVVQLELVQPSVSKSVIIRSRVDQILSAESSGVVQRRAVADGARVDVDAVLLELSADVEEAELQTALADEHALATTNTPLRIRRASEARTARARDQVEKRTLRAPVAGRIEGWMVQEGAWVNPGTPVARLVDGGRLYAVASLLEDEILLVREGVLCSLWTAARPETPIEVRSCRLGGAPLHGRGQYDFEVEWAGAEGLLPGMLASLLIPLGEARSELRIPTASVQEKNGEAQVWVAEPRDLTLVAAPRIVRTEPVPGRADLLRVMEGLRPADQVVVRGTLGIRAGDLLRTEPSPP